MPFVNTAKLKAREPLPGWTGRYLVTDNLTLAYYDFTAGSEIHEHAHENEEVWNVLEGELEVRLDGRKRVAGPGVAAVVPSNVRHGVRALTDGRALVVDHGRRETIAGMRIV